MPHHDHATHDQPWHGHDEDVPEEFKFTQEFWDDRYGSAGRLWSGQPNAQLVEQASGLEPGEALDAGCGEGGDAIWLAGQGWTVTAVDVSQVALDRGAAAAAAAGDGVAGRIRWQREDLLTWAPEPGRYGLVSAQYMHLPLEMFGDFLARLAAAVRARRHPAGRRPPPGRPARQRRPSRPGPPVRAGRAAGRGPGPGELGGRGRRGLRPVAKDLDGQPVTVRDTVLRATRRA